MSSPFSVSNANAAPHSQPCGLVLLLTVAVANVGCGDGLNFLDALPPSGNDATSPGSMLRDAGIGDAPLSPIDVFSADASECNPLADDCEAGTHCASLPGAGNQCVTDSSNAAAIGEPCQSGDTMHPDNCMAGAFCYQGSCHEMCNAYNDPGCVDGTTCLGFAGYSFDLCMDDCHPLSQNPCESSLAGNPQACYVTPRGSVCIPTSGGTDLGERCSYINECRGGTGCFDSGRGMRCHRYCDYQHYPKGSDPRCDDGQRCHKIRGEPAIGICSN